MPHPAARPLLPTLGTTLAVWAHPDDETYLAGGVLSWLVSTGARVACVTATRGEAADPAAAPPERTALAAVRTEELSDALAVLGVHDHVWLDHPDGGCADVDPSGPAGQIAAEVERVRPDTVLTFGPDGFTGHPDHRMVSAWVDTAIRRSTARPRVLHAVVAQRDWGADRTVADRFGVYELGEPRRCADEELVVRLVLEGELLERKVQALLRQASQTAPLVSALGLDAFARWVSVESFAPALPRPDEEPVREVAAGAE